jgi:hypothetical protein
MATLVIKTAAASDEAYVIDVLVRAFAADPAARWGWPEQQQYYICIFLALSGHYSVAKRLHTEVPTILKISEFFFLLFQLLHIYNDVRKKERKSRVLWPLYCIGHIRSFQGSYC